MAGNFGTVRVDPVALTATAEEAMHSIYEYRSSIEQLSKLVTSTIECWRGEAGEAFRKVFEIELKRAMDALAVYEQYPKDLLEYAGLYEEVVRITEESASSVSEFRMQ